MATVILGSEKLNELEDSFKPIIKKIFNDTPSTFVYGGHSYSVEIIVVCGRRSPAENAAVGGARHSKHLYGLAVDYTLNLNGSPFSYPGSYTSGYSASATQKIPNTNIYVNANDVFALVGNQATPNGCTWGGTFSKYDPVHIQSNITKLPNGLIIGGDDELMVYENLSTSDAANTYTATAGESSKLDSQNPIVQPDNTILYIGYDLTLSELSNIPEGSTPLKDLLASANVSQDTINALLPLNGLSGAAALAKYQSNPNVSITEDNADLILKKQVTDLVGFLKNMKGFDSSQYPKEISTAIVSYFFAKNMSTPENSSQIDDMLKILISSTNKAVDLARYIETKAVNLPSDIKARRLREAQLLRGYNPNPSATPDSSITSTGDQGAYQNNTELLALQAHNQLDEIKKLFGSRNSSSNDPASSEYDDSFNDIDQSTLDAIAAIMQSQQVNSDIYFGFKESEYNYRIKTKNFYSILARKLNTTISNIDKLLQTEETLKDYQNYSFATMYSMIPYSDGMAYNIKKNAVSRCQYRIRLLELRIKNNESSLMSLGVPSTNSFLDIAEFIYFLPFKLNVIAAALLIDEIKSFFTTLGVLREQLKLEKGNLSRLKKDMNRYSG